MGREPHSDRRPRWSGAAWWAPGLLVAVGAAAATAHGLYGVVHAAGVPAVIAWLYPVITDGLALVAYAAMPRLSGGSRRYAAAVVVLAAGLSGLAQASYLAQAGVPATGPATAVAAHAVTQAPPLPAVLRFGVGAWPAIAAAIVAHLLVLIAAQARAHRHTDTPAQPIHSSTVHSPTVQPAVRGPAGPGGQSPVQPAAPSTESRPVSTPAVQPSPRRALPSTAGSERRPPSTPGLSRADAASTVARRHLAHHGELPTVSQLMALAQVSRGTAGNALKELREHPPALQIVHDNDQASTQP